MPVSALLPALSKRCASLWLLHAARPASTSAAAAAVGAEGLLPLSLPVVCVWGANTGVGKTLVSAGLAAACAQEKTPLLYLKPVQTGFPADSDARLVAAAGGLPLEHHPHAAALLPPAQRQQQPGGSSRDPAAGSGSGSLARVLYAWQQPVSPHVAVEQEGRAVGDQEIVAALQQSLATFAAGVAGGPPPMALVETAGGVASPGPSGTLQCDLLRPLRLPSLLVGDGRLGGISATLCAYETLLLRGYDVPLIALLDSDPQLGNAAAIQRQLGSAAHVLALPPCPPPPAAAPAQQQQNQQQQQQQLDASLAGWLVTSRPQFAQALQLLREQHEQRLAALQGAAAEARQTLWWPFTQHGRVRGDHAVTVIDARVGEAFAVFRPGGEAAGGSRSSSSDSSQRSSSGSSSSSSDMCSTSGTGSAGPALQLQQDACASWWTQGVGAKAQPALVRATAATAGRYGHVMFPESVHAPALALAQSLLAGVGAGWAGRVFYSDNGSTAVEVALKMAFRKFMLDQGLLEQEGVELQVVGLHEAYHGDTLGAMEAVPPTPFNGRLQTPWYSGRGLFLDPPTAALEKGAWRLRLPAALARAPGATAAAAAAEAALGSSQALFAAERRRSLLAALYAAHIEGALEAHSKAHPRVALGAAILEPVLQGAGGMRLLDPLFQREMVQACRRRGIPVIFDEVFTGLWRLGAPSGAALLGESPDIGCYAKLLTGGLVPLAATLASDPIFEAFSGDTKAAALLHGHSYTAHPVGCGAANAALAMYTDPATNPNWRGGGSCSGSGSGANARLAVQWEEARVAALSCHPCVERALALGSVLAAELRGGSDAAGAVVARLRTAGVYARPLGGVVYLMVSPMTTSDACQGLLDKLLAALEPCPRGQPQQDGRCCCV